VEADGVDSPFAHVPDPGIHEVSPLTWEGQIETAGQFARGARSTSSPGARWVGLLAIAGLVLLALVPVALLVVALVNSLFD
jgi:hypothetical protein